MKGAGPEKLVLLGGLQVDRSNIGKTEGLTLADTLRALHEAADQPVALLSDEAQHALSSEAGERAMTALKSARGEYMVEDVAMRRWFEACTATASWPPRRAQTELAFARETDHT